MKLSILTVLAVLASRGLAQTPAFDAEAARQAMVDVNKIWGKARVDLDRDTMEKMLAPDFYVQIGTQKITRKDFIDQNAAKTTGVVMKRFDVKVQTVQPTPDGGVSAVIAERLEVERTMPDGKKVTVYSLWITKDIWKKGEKGWQALSSEAIGFEYWRDKKPPASVWD